MDYEYECPVCRREFNSQHAVNQHMNAKGHWPVECARCDRTFTNKQDCQEHEYEAHKHCSEYDRSFQNYNDLRMHLDSSRHRGGNVTCPFCRKSLTTATGLAHHLEMNAGPNADTNRDEIYQYVRSKDPRGIISKNLLEWNGSPEYEASERTWNGYAYECYLCRREFGRLHGLNQHLNSPAHQQSLYHCPNRNCRDFKSLAGIINHLESESCGLILFDAVQRGVSQMIGSGRLLGF